MTTPWAITASVLMHAATVAAAETTGLSIKDHLDFQNERMEIDAQTGAPGMSCMACHEPAHLSLQDKRSAQKGLP